ncbi:MAG: hypothetical protein K9M84_04080 [Spirochaetia bacterium]|nr:hypothetical protein [Spirochaetia bacterium]MCF7940767.1 hypothetical protein [Spirochaetia bacterium]
MSAAETMHSWPVQVSEDAEIPEEWVQKKVFGTGCSSAVYFPSQPYGLFKRHSVFLGFKDEMFVYGDSKRSIEIPFSDIIVLKHLKVLLTGRLMIRTINRTYKIEYNLTKDRIVTPLVEAYRAYNIKHATPFEIDIKKLEAITEEHEEPLVNFRDRLEQRNIKLYNYLCEELPGKEDKEVLYYQESTEHHLRQKISGSHYYYTPYLIARTAHEIILFNEEDHIAEQPDEYGVQISFIQESEKITWEIERKAHGGELRVLYEDRTLFKLHVPEQSLQRAYTACQVLNT